MLVKPCELTALALAPGSTPPSYLSHRTGIEQIVTTAARRALMP
ncbi:hypothetical protein [Nannocystis exedens]|nr:hypothetical protein [Nannocystis exedens]